jgi:hypothetical protein
MLINPYLFSYDKILVFMFYLNLFTGSAILQQFATDHQAAYGLHKAALSVGSAG